MRIEPWSPDDLPLLEKTVGDPAMMEHLGGAETPEKMAERQARYEKPDSGMFKIVDDESGAAVGSVGYWEREWRSEAVYEAGWLVVPEFQGRGFATEAMKQVIDLAGSRPIHAFPSVENGPSNAICRKLGFTLLEEISLEYPPGHWMRCSDWRLEPTPESPSSA